MYDCNSHINCMAYYRMLGLEFEEKDVNTNPMIKKGFFKYNSNVRMNNKVYVYCKSPLTHRRTTPDVNLRVLANRP